MLSSSRTRVAAAAARGRLAKNHPVRRVGRIITARYWVKATNSPSVIAPSTTRIPPSQSTMTVPAEGISSKRGLKIADTLARRSVRS